MFNEQRTSQRKVLKVKAVVVVDGFAPVGARTMDLGSTGICITAPDPIKVGAHAHLRFDVPVDGVPAPVEVECKAVYCVFSQGDFKVGFQFLNLNLSGMTRVAKFLR